MEYLRRHERSDPARVGLFGIGRGAVLAPRVAARVRTAFVAAVSPPADAAAPWGAITAPALVLYGERDRHPARESAVLLARAFLESGAAGRVEIVAGADHALRLAPRHGEPFDFPRFSPAALDTLLAFARRASGLPPERVVLAPPKR